MDNFTCEFIFIFKIKRFSFFFFVQNREKLTEGNVETSELMKSIEPNSILHDVFNYNSQDKEIIEKWLLDGFTIYK